MLIKSLTPRSWPAAAVGARPDYLQRHAGGGHSHDWDTVRWLWARTTSASTWRRQY